MRERCIAIGAVAVLGLWSIAGAFCGEGLLAIREVSGADISGRGCCTNICSEVKTTCPTANPQCSVKCTKQYCTCGTASSGQTKNAVPSAGASEQCQAAGNNCASQLFVRCNMCGCTTVKVSD